MKDVTLTQMKEVTVIVKKEKHKKSNFPLGGIVMINGHNFDNYKFSTYSRKQQPTPFEL